MGILEKHASIAPLLSKELGEGGSTGNENEWEARKVGRRKNFLVQRIELAKHFIRTNINPEWMVLCLLPVLPPELRQKVSGRDHLIQQYEHDTKANP
ncbi:hypothetical protein HN51_003209 [Arachis hypogaea]